MDKLFSNINDKDININIHNILSSKYKDLNKDESNYIIISIINHNDINDELNKKYFINCIISYISSVNSNIFTKSKLNEYKNYEEFNGIHCYIYDKYIFLNCNYSFKNIKICNKILYLISDIIIYIKKYTEYNDYTWYTPGDNDIYLKYLISNIYDINKDDYIERYKKPFLIINSYTYNDIDDIECTNEKSKIINTKIISECFNFFNEKYGKNYNINDFFSDILFIKTFNVNELSLEQKFNLLDDNYFIIKNINIVLINFIVVKKNYIMSFMIILTNLI